MANISIYGVLVNDTTEGIVTRTDQVFDKIQNKTQETINKEIFNKFLGFDSLSETYEDVVIKDSDNAVKSSGIWRAINDVSNRMPYIGEDGYAYVWDFELGEYKRVGNSLIGEQGVAATTVHLVFDSVVLTVDEFGVLRPSSPIRVRAIKQFGETGLFPFTEGCIKWWINDKDPEVDEPDGEEIGKSEIYVDINKDLVEKVQFILYLDKEATLAYDFQSIFLIKHPNMYKLDLTNETSIVPMSDEEGNVDDAFLEPTQAILYHGAEQIDPSKVKFSIEYHDGLKSATIDEEGNVTVSGWYPEWSTVQVKIKAVYTVGGTDYTFYAIYSIARVAGMTIYRIQPSVTAIKQKKDGSFVTDKLYANVVKVLSSNSGPVLEKVNDYGGEGISVRYTIDNVQSTVYNLNGPNDFVQIVDGYDEIDLYVVKASQPEGDIETYHDHETVPVVIDGDDSYFMYLSNESSTVNCDSQGNQVGQLMNTQGILMKGVQNVSDLCYWGNPDFYDSSTGKQLLEVYPTGAIYPTPYFSRTVPGYVELSGSTLSATVEQAEVIVEARYEGNDGDITKYIKKYIISKSKQGSIGESGYKSVVFCRTNSTPARPSASDGSYANPVPTGNVKDTEGNDLGIKWTDSITGSTGIIWATSRLFTTNGTDQDDEWSKPSQMVDTDSFDVEFSPYEDPGYPDTDADADKWFDPTEDPEMFMPDKQPMVWMATRTLNNGAPVMHLDPNHPNKITSWSIMRIKGEDGDSQFKSMVFCRLPSGVTPDAPSSTDGSFAAPVPTGEVTSSGSKTGAWWSDGIPDGEPTYVVWATSRTMYSNQSVQEDWTTPIIMKDVPNLYDVEYSLSENPPSGDPEEYPNEWYDPDELSLEEQMNVVWMAQRWYTSDGWSEWQVIKVKGESAEYCLLESNVGSITRKLSNGLYIPDSIIVTAYKLKGAEKATTEDGYINVYGYNSSGTRSSKLVGTSSKDSSLVFYPGNYDKYDVYQFELSTTSSEGGTLIAAPITVAVSEEQLPGGVGENAVFNLIEANVSSITRKLANGKYIPEAIVVTSYEINGSEKAEKTLGYFQVYGYDADGNRSDMLQTAVNSSELIFRPEDRSGYSVYQVELRSSSESSSTLLAAPITVSVVEEQKPGTTGASGPIVYPRGEWNASSNYEFSQKIVDGVVVATPYVYYGNKFFVLNTASTSSTTPPQDGDTWIEMEKYEALYTEILLADSALVGAAVFNGDYMFSQAGVGSGSFADFNKTDPYGSSSVFKPNWCVDLMKGRMWSGAGSVYFAEDGSGQLANGLIYWTTDGGLYLPPSGDISYTFGVNSEGTGTRYNIEYTLRNGGTISPDDVEIVVWAGPNKNGSGSDVLDTISITDGLPYKGKYSGNLSDGVSIPEYFGIRCDNPIKYGEYIEVSSVKTDGEVGKGVMTAQIATYRSDIYSSFTVTDYSPKTSWTVIKPTVYSGEAGAMVTQEDDGSNNMTVVYTVALRNPSATSPTTIQISNKSDSTVTISKTNGETIATVTGSGSSYDIPAGESAFRIKQVVTSFSGNKVMNIAIN